VFGRLNQMNPMRAANSPALFSLQLRTFCLNSNNECVFWALEARPSPWLVSGRHDGGESSMKKLALATAAMLALLSIAGCAQYVGKGKARRLSLPRGKLPAKQG
jgi:hypothetical protein